MKNKNFKVQQPAPPFPPVQLNDFWTIKFTF